MGRFDHSGDLGDVVYSLPAVRAAGGGEYRLFERAGRREPMTRKRAELILPLLRQQEYITQARYADKGKVTAFDDFRVHLAYRRTLVDTHYIAIGIEPPGLTQKWLSVEPIDSGYQVLFARSPRYRNVAFPWLRAYEQYRDVAAFVGLKVEHEEFCKTFGDVPYLPTKDLIELSQVIAGSDLFVGNQSCPMAIAHGLGASVLMEVAADPWADNCRLNRPNASYGVDGSVKLPEIRSAVTAGESWR